MTVTTIAQLPAAATDPPLSATAELPATAVTVPAPQVVDAFGVAAIVRSAGSVSLSDIPFNNVAPEAVFAIVIVKVDVPPGAIVADEKLLVIVGAGGAVSVTVPDAGFWLAYPPIESAPTAIVLVTEPVPAVDDVVTGT